MEVTRSAFILEVTAPTKCPNAPSSREDLDLALSAFSFLVRPHHHFVHPLKQGRSLYLPYIKSYTRNGCPNRAKCSSYVGPGGQATKQLSPFSDYLCHLHPSLKNKLVLSNMSF